MKEINLPSGNYLFIEVPDDATNFKIVFEDSIKYYSEDNSLADGNDGKACYTRYRYFDEFKNEDTIVSTTKDITEEQAGSIVKRGGIYTYKDYTYINKNLDEVGLFDALLEMKFKTAKESLQSLIQANGLDVSKNYLILRKI